mgnify:CR=1 FL=1
MYIYIQVFDRSDLMKILTINFKKLENISFKDTLNRENEFSRSDEKRKSELINRWIETENYKDQPQIFYSKEIII